MKAVLHLVTGGGKALASIKYILTLKGGTEEDKVGDLGARVGGIWKSDDLQGIDQSDHKALAKKIEAPTRLFCSKGGRHRDHLVLSVPTGESVEAFRLRVPQALEDLQQELQIKTYVAALHVDCAHPHLHIVCDAYAPGCGKGQRRHCNRSKLRRLNENEWSKDFEAPTPSADGTHSRGGRVILDGKFKRVPQAKVDLASEVFYKLGGKLGSVEDMAERLENCNCEGMCLDFRDSKGRVKRSAVVIKRGVKMRLSWLLQQKENLWKTTQFQHVLNKPKEDDFKTVGDWLSCTENWKKLINPLPPKKSNSLKKILPAVKKGVCGGCGNLKINCSCDSSR